MMRLTLLLLLLLGIAVLSACDALSPSGVAAEDLIYSDAFNAGESGRWRIESDQVAGSTLLDGHLEIAVTEAQTVHYTTLDGEFFDDFMLEIDATLLGGNPANSYGVLFRIAGPAQFYRFEVTGNGFFALERHDNAGEWTRLTDGWQEAPALNQGVGAVNRLRITAVGDSLTLAINDQDVALLTDSSYRQGSIGLDAGTFSRPGVQAGFDNLIVLRP